MARRMQPDEAVSKYRGGQADFLSDLPQWISGERTLAGSRGTKINRDEKRTLIQGYIKMKGRTLIINFDPVERVDFVRPIAIHHFQ